MKSVFVLILALLMLNACGPTKKKALTPLELEQEKQAVAKVLEDYNIAFENKDFSKVVETLADEVIFFGTDSSEVIKTFADYKAAIEKQWKYFDNVHYGPLKDISIQMDDNATLATIIYGVNADFTKGDSTHSYYLRVARILKKKADKWLIISGIVSIVRDDDHHNQSSSSANE